jgi:Alpha/beta hydrolase domain
MQPRLISCLVATAAIAAACSSGSSTVSPTSSTASTTATTTAATTTITPAPATTASTAAPATTTTIAKPAFKPDAVGRASVAGPVTGGKGAVVIGVPSFDLTTVGYVQEEYFIAGTASAYQSASPLSADGNWTVTPMTPTPYTTRVVVRRPANATAFKGTVAVEWMNVTAGFDNGIDWTYSHVELIRSGWAWIGVSAQSVGVNGGGNALGAALALKTADPERYGSLNHPGDSYSYDMFSQVGAAVRTQPSTLLGSLKPERVIAVGESQSAFRLNTYINAVAPIANVYDGYLVHSRGAAGAPLTQDLLPAIAVPNPTLVRTDLRVPVLTVLSETDVVGDRLNYRTARQPDTDFVRAWEMAGTAHADAYSLGIGDNDDGSGKADKAFFDTLAAPPTSIYGGAVKCDLPLNTGAHTYVLRSAFAALDSWIRSGKPPASTPRLELTDAGALVLDAAGNAKGGIRTPHVDVPRATLSGLGQSGSSFCFLFGTTAPFDEAKLASLYPAAGSFSTAWVKAVDNAVATGAILPADAERLRAVVAAT